MVIIADFVVSSVRDGNFKEIFSMMPEKSILEQQLGQFTFFDFNWEF